MDVEEEHLNIVTRQGRGNGLNGLLSLTAPNSLTDACSESNEGSKVTAFHVHR